MRLSSRKLAASLAKRLNEVMPPTFELRANQPLILPPPFGQSNCPLALYIISSFDTTLSAVEGVEDESREFPERLDGSVWAVLDSVQDSVSEHLRIPWPSTDGREMAAPNVRSSAGAIHLWYGDSEEAPVLRIRHIPLAEITDDA
jgi:hypothetical protein